MHINYKNHICKFCGRECKNRRSLGNHLARSHKPENIKTYCLKFYLDGKIPLCECGCGKDVNWHKTQYKFNRYISGHNESWTSENQPILTKKQIENRNASIRKAYRERGQEIKKKISSSLKCTFSDPVQKERMAQVMYKKWADPLWVEAQHKARVKSWQGEPGRVRREKIFTKAFGRKISEANMRRDTKRKSEQEIIMFNLIKGMLSKINVAIKEDFWINTKDYIRCYDAFIPQWNLLVELDGSYWHGLDRKENFTADQVHNMTNDMYKNELAISENKGLVRINMDKVSIERIECVEDLIKVSYYAHVDGSTIKNDSFKFHTTKQPLITRNEMIKINDESLGGPGKEYTEDILKPKLIKFFQEYVRQNGWWEYRTKDTLEKVITELRGAELDFDQGFISSLTRTGNDYLKSIFSSYWNVDGGPAKEWFNDKKMDKVISYRLGLNNSKDYTYTLDDGNEWTGRETFNISPHTLVRGYIVQRNAVSWFKPSAAYHIYRRFLGGVDNPVVWDPSMGFGARMLGFAAAHKDGVYIGTDPATETFRDLLALKDKLDECAMFDGAISPFKIGSEIIELEASSGDLVFTSPPYFSVERYYNEPGQCWRDYPELDLWIEKYLIPTFKNAYDFLKADRYMVINVSKDYFDIVMNSALSVGFTYSETLKLKTGRDHFSKKNGISKMNFEPILIFRK